MIALAVPCFRTVPFTPVPALTIITSALIVILESKVLVPMVRVPVEGVSVSGWGRVVVEMFPPELLMVI